MDIHRWISQQQDVVQSPLFAVSLVAVKQPNTPLLLLLHWHGFRRATPLSLPDIKPALHAIPGSAVQINEAWDRFEQVDAGALDAAWQLGAWDLNRTVRRGCNELAAGETEAEECRRAFGVYNDIDGPCPSQLLDDAAPDRAELMTIAARTGYARWLFRPVSGGLWGEVSDDVTLREDGSRLPPCPVMPACADVPTRVLRRRQGSRTTYRLGRGGQFIRH